MDLIGLVLIATKLQFVFGHQHHSCYQLFPEVWVSFANHWKGN